MEGERLYCICQQPYDEENKQFMIACDRCDEWLHGTCIGVDEKMAERYEKYYCVSCQSLYNIQSVLKDGSLVKNLKCARNNCLRISAPNSRYCSETCGLKVARQRLGSIHKKISRILGHDTCTIDISADISKNFLYSLHETLSMLRNAQEFQMQAITQSKTSCEKILADIQKIDFIWSKVMEKTDVNCGYPLKVIGHYLTPGSLVCVPHISKPDGTLYGIEEMQESISSLDFPVCNQSKKCALHVGYFDIRQGELERERETQLALLRTTEDKERLLTDMLDHQQNDWRSILVHFVNAI